MVVDFGGEGAKYNLSYQMQPTKELGPTSGRYTFDVHASTGYLSDVGTSSAIC